MGKFIYHQWGRLLAITSATCESYCILGLLVRTKTLTYRYVMGSVQRIHRALMISFNVGFLLPQILLGCHVSQPGVIAAKADGLAAVLSDLLVSCTYHHRCIGRI
jgi:hypothetical protein